MENKYDKNKYKSIDLRYFLNRYGCFDDVTDDKGWCPIHEMDGKPHSSKSLIYDKRYNTCTCWVCCNPNRDKNLASYGYRGNNMDCFNIVEILEGIHDFRKIMDRLDEILNSNIDVSRKVIEKKHEVKIKTKVELNIESNNYRKEKYENFLKYSRNLHEAHLHNEFFVDKYLQLRHIKYDRIEKMLSDNGIELRYQYQKIEGRNKMYSCFVDYNNELTIRRCINDYLFGEDIKEYDIIGSNHYTHINNNSEETLIFESFYDMICMMSRIKNLEKYNYVSLNSTNTTVQFINHYPNLEKEKFYLLVDNDEAGDKVIEKIQRLADSKGININYVDSRFIYNGYNDVCEAIDKGYNFMINNNLEELLVD